MALPPLVLIPGIQGRWEYMRRAVDALAPFCRVLTFSLDEVDASRAFNRDKGLDGYVDHIEQMLNALNLDRAIMCGVSFGGIIALRFAARRPERTSALILVSTPGLHWNLARRERLFTRFPWLTSPLFFAGMPQRVRGEIVRAIPGLRERAAFGWEQARTLGRAPVSPRRMAARARLIATADAASECARVVVPTLIVTGEPALDRIVSVSGSDGAGGTLGYARLISGARVVQLDRTGHLGSVTRPREFAAAIGRFLADVRDRHAA